MEETPHIIKTKHRLLRATLIYMLKEKEPQINKTKHRLLRGIPMEILEDIK